MPFSIMKYLHVRHFAAFRIFFAWIGKSALSSVSASVVFCASVNTGHRVGVSLHVTISMLFIYVIFFLKPIMETF